MSLVTLHAFPITINFCTILSNILFLDIQHIQFTILNTNEMILNILRVIVSLTHITADLALLQICGELFTA